MKAIGVIPARYDSTRFPGKPLAIIKGKTLIERVWRRAGAAGLLDELVIATDDRRIQAKAEAFGAKVVMTSKTLKSGTDRLAAVARKYPKGAIFINIQGDEPLIDPRLIDELVRTLAKDRRADVVTAVHPLKDRRETENPNVVKAVLDKAGYALYFSRYPVPFSRSGAPQRRYKHLGIYGYRRDALLKFSSLPQGVLEQAEKLEQLRLLENGFRIKAVISKKDSYGVDIPQDIKKIERKI